MESSKRKIVTGPQDQPRIVYIPRGKKAKNKPGLQNKPVVHIPTPVVSHDQPVPVAKLLEKKVDIEHVQQKHVAVEPPKKATPPKKPLPPRPPVTRSVARRRDQILGAAALNTHFFDGKMGEIIDFIRPEIERAHSTPREEKLLSFEELFVKLQLNPLFNMNALRCFGLIRSSFEGDNRANYDSANRLYADDLLYLLYEKVIGENSEEHEVLLCVQLDEMASGTCPQGRTTRLLQVLVMLRDDLTPTSK